MAITVQLAGHREFLVDDAVVGMEFQHIHTCGEVGSVDVGVDVVDRNSHNILAEQIINFNLADVAVGIDVENAVGGIREDFDLQVVVFDTQRRQWSW